MSSLINSARAGARTRVPRFAEAAVERARLTVVPPRRSLGRTQAARTPFAVLVIAMLAAGVVGLLMFNTNMQQASFKATALQDRVNVLTAKEQSLDMELDQLRDPQSLAVAAKALGMVAPSQPAFVRLSDGRVLGNPTPATPAEAVRINPLPAKLPASIKRKKIIVKVPATAVRPARSRPTSGTSALRAPTPPAPPPLAHGEGDRKRASTELRPVARFRSIHIDPSRSPGSRAVCVARPTCDCGSGSSSSRCCSRSSGRGCSSSRASTPRPMPPAPRQPGLVSIELPAKRGRILDRNGVPLAESIAGLMIVADPTRTTPHAEAIAKILAERLHMDYFDLLAS